MLDGVLVRGGGVRAHLCPRGPQYRRDRQSAPRALRGRLSAGTSHTGLRVRVRAVHYHSNSKDFSVSRLELRRFVSFSSGSSDFCECVIIHILES